MYFPPFFFSTAAKMKEIISILPFNTPYIFLITTFVASSYKQQTAFSKLFFNVCISRSFELFPIYFNLSFFSAIFKLFSNIRVDRYSFLLNDVKSCHVLSFRFLFVSIAFICFAFSFGTKFFVFSSFR